MGDLQRLQALKPQLNGRRLHEHGVPDPWDRRDSAVLGGEGAEEELTALPGEIEPLPVSERSASSRSAHVARASDKGHFLTSRGQRADLCPRSRRAGSPQPHRQDVRRQSHTRGAWEMQGRRRRGGGTKSEWRGRSGMVLGKGQHSRLNVHDGQELVSHRGERPLSRGGGGSTWKREDREEEGAHGGGGSTWRREHREEEGAHEGGGSTWRRPRC